MEMLENKLSVQELAVFLRDAAYSEALFHHTDHTLSITAPRDEKGDVVYEGGLYTHNRVQKPLHYYHLTFSYTESRGIYGIQASKNRSIVHKAEAMDFDSFKAFVIGLYEIEQLYDSSYHSGLYRSRPVRNSPPLQDIAEYLANTCKTDKATKIPLDWSMYVIHPHDNNSDVGYSGGIWTAQPIDAPLSKPYCSVSFSYSRTCGVHGVLAFRDRYMIRQEEKMSFDAFQNLIEKLFSIVLPVRSTRKVPAANFPRQFEINAMKQAEQILDEWSQKEE